MGLLISKLSCASKPIEDPEPIIETLPDMCPECGLLSNFYTMATPGTFYCANGHNWDGAQYSQ